MWFFSKYPLGAQFVSFGPLHLTIIGLLALAIVLTVVFRDRLRARPKVYRWLPVWIGAVAWALEIVFHWWTYINDLDFVSSLIPLELCYVSLLFTVVLCITRNKAVFEIFYFISFGALLSVIIADQGGFMPDHFRFWHYFIVHGYIVWLNAWYLSVEKYKIRRDSYVRLLVFMVPLAAIAQLANWKFGLNYMFLMRPPAESNPLDLFGTGVWYDVKYVALALVVFFIMYLVAPKVPLKPKVPASPELVMPGVPAEMTNE